MTDGKTLRDDELAADSAAGATPGRKPWKTPVVIIGAMSGARATFINGTTFNDGHNSYTS
jgi:hypothetical protein